jgi:single stranded DNA-binding protein
MNSVNLIGRLTRDPELFTTQGGTDIGRLRLAVARRRRDGALFLDVKCFEGQARACMQHLGKGHEVAVTGQLELDEWEAEGAASGPGSTRSRRGSSSCAGRSRRRTSRRTRTSTAAASRTTAGSSQSSAATHAAQRSRAPSAQADTMSDEQSHSPNRRGRRRRSGSGLPGWVGSVAMAVSPPTDAASLTLRPAARGRRDSRTRYQCFKASSSS